VFSGYFLSFYVKPKNHKTIKTIKKTKTEENKIFILKTIGVSTPGL